MRNYKKVSECPKELDDIIQLVNLLPKNIDEIFVELRGLLFSFANERNEIWESEKNGKIFQDKVLDLLVLHFPVIDYMYDQVRDSDAAKAFYNLESLVYAKQIFAAIAQARRDADKVIDFHKDWFERAGNVASQIDKIRREEIDSRLSPFTFTSRLHLDENWNIKPRLPDVIRIFGEQDIPVERIRQCPICEDIFWSKKTNSITCGKKKCGDDFQNLKKKEAREAAKKTKERK